MAVSTQKLATTILSTMAVLCSVAALAILFFPITTSGNPVGASSAMVARVDFDPHFWLFFVLMSGAAVSGVAAFAAWNSR